MITEPIIGKYKVIQTRALKTKEGYASMPVLTTDNAREAVWVANKDPERLSVEHICGEKDFYKGEDGLWHSFNL